MYIYMDIYIWIYIYIYIWSGVQSRRKRVMCCSAPCARKRRG